MVVLIFLFVNTFFVATSPIAVCVFVAARFQGFFCPLKLPLLMVGRPWIPLIKPTSALQCSKLHNCSMLHYCNNHL